jgi:hypothetical protein
MTAEDRAAALAKLKQVPVPTPWTYEGDEQALIEMTEQQEREEKSVSGVPKSNQQLEEALNRVHDASDLRETLLSTLAAQGQITRTRDDAFNTHLVIRQPEPDASLPANGFKFEREIHFAPSTGKRSLVIRANSLEDLIA